MLLNPSSPNRRPPPLEASPIGTSVRLCRTPIGGHGSPRSGELYRRERPLAEGGGLTPGATGIVALMVEKDKAILAAALVSWGAAVLAGIVRAADGPARLYGSLFGLSGVLLLGTLREQRRLQELLARRLGGAAWPGHWPPPLWPRVCIFALFVGALATALPLFSTGELVPSLVMGLFFAVATFVFMAVRIAMERRRDR